jgi:hypothetical protein
MPAERKTRVFFICTARRKSKKSGSVVRMQQRARAAAKTVPDVNDINALVPR